MARVTVVGGTGFVGRQLCADLARGGADVLVIARRPPSRAGFRCVGLDLGTEPAARVRDLLAAEKPDVIVNATGGIWGLDNDQMEANCTRPGLRLLAAVEEAAAQSRLVHLGSVLEYGPLPRGGWTHPDLPARPDTAYGRAKLRATEGVLSAARDGRADGVVLRLANVAGPGAPAVSLLGRVASQLASGPLVEVNSLDAHRDYVDVRDVSRAIMAAFEAPVAGRVIDIGRGQAVSVRWLVQELIAVSGVPGRLVEKPPPGAASDWLRVDPEPAARLLGWRPRHDLTSSLRGLWDQFRAQ